MSTIESQTEMNVTKRNGTTEVMSFDKILNRVKNLGKMEPLLMCVNYTELVIKVIEQLYDRITTMEIDELTSEQCASMARIVISNHQKNTSDSFSEVVQQLFYFKDIHGDNHPLVNNGLYYQTQQNANTLNSMIDYSRDFEIDYFGFKTLERAYLMKVNGKIIERPQHMWMRVALAIHGADLGKVRETYDLMSKKYFTHATPTLFNAGTPRQQMSSCYLLAMENDSISGIYNTLSDCAAISKWAGGIGLHIHNVRASGTHIRGTNGTSNGIVPM